MDCLLQAKASNRSSCTRGQRSLTPNCTVKADASLTFAGVFRWIQASINGSFGRIPDAANAAHGLRLDRTFTVTQHAVIKRIELGYKNGDVHHDIFTTQLGIILLLTIITDSLPDQFHQAQARHTLQLALSHVSLRRSPQSCESARCRRCTTHCSTSYRG
jgi:hypothetical protein